MRKEVHKEEITTVFYTKRMFNFLIETRKSTSKFQVRINNANINQYVNLEHNVF